MKKNLTKIPIGAVMLAIALLGTSSSVFAAGGTATTTPDNQASMLANIKDKADQEVTRRIDILNKTIMRLGEMKKLSADDKAYLSSVAQKNIDEFNALKAKIDADTTASEARKDRQGITKLYRIFMLVIPQIQIIAAADRISATADILTDVATKLQTKISDAQSAGKDVSALNTSMTEMQAKIADAKKQASDAILAVKALTPNQGNATTMSSNVAALKKARDMVKVGRDDLVIARKDAGDIRDGLEAFGK